MTTYAELKIQSELPRNELQNDNKESAVINLAQYLATDSNDSSFWHSGIYGPVRKGETLWEITLKLIDDFPEASFFQLMMALLKVNPDSFVDNNINKLKTNAILHVPSNSNLTKISKEQAANDYKIQLLNRKHNKQLKEVQLIQSRIQNEVLNSTQQQYRMIPITRSLSGNAYKSIDQKRLQGKVDLGAIYQSASVFQENDAWLQSYAIVEPPMVELHKYPTIEAPYNVKPDQTFAVQVSLTQDVITPESGTEAKVFSLYQSDNWEIEVVLSGSGFEFDNDSNSKTIDLPNQGNSSIAKFLLKATEAGEAVRSVYASFYHQNEFLFRARRQIKIDKSAVRASESFSAQAAPKAKPVELTLQHNSSPPDLTIEIIGGQIVIRGKNLSGSSNRYSQHEGLGTFLEQNYAQLASMTNRGANPVDGNTIKDTAKGIGELLYRQFAPESFKRALCHQIEHLKEAFQTIQVYSANPLLPWELMIPTCQTDAGRITTDHLGLAFQVSRWYARENQVDAITAPPNILGINEVTVLRPQYDPPLKATEQEILSLQQLLPDQNKFNLVEGSKEQFRQSLQQFPDGILHFAGHGMITQEQSGSTVYSILMEDGSSLSLNEWRGILANNSTYCPLVFFNACDIGRSRRTMGFVDGWAPAILDAGASGYLGTMWPVNDESAAQFAVSFYKNLFKVNQSGKRMSVAKAIHEARKTYHENPDPSFLAYIFYGNSNLSVKFNGS